MTNKDANYEIKEHSATQVTVQVTVEPQAVQDGMETIYHRYSREVQIPGFRKGHVPRSFLDSRFGHEMFLDETQEELKEKYLPKAISALGLHPVTPPEVKTVSLDAGGTFIFDASFAILPEFDLPEYRGIKLTVEPEQEITENDVQAALEEIRHQYGTLTPKESEVVNEGDIVSVKEGAKEWDTHVEAKNPLTEKLLGHKVGDTVEVELDLSGGQPVHMSLSIRGLKEIVLPDVNDELAKDAGFETLAVLKEDIKAKLEQAHAKRRVQTLKVNLLDHLVDQMEIPLPEALVEEMTKEKLEELKKNLSHPRSPLSFEEYLTKQQKSEEDVHADYSKIVTRRVRRDLLLQKIAVKEGISIDDEELERLASEEAEKEGENPLRAIARLKAEERWEGYRSQKVNARVLDLLYETAKFTEEAK